MVFCRLFVFPTVFVSCVIVASKGARVFVDSCFASSGVEEASIPDGVRELCEGCFEGCSSLRRVMFGSSSSLERIGFRAFPKSVSYLCDHVSLK